VESPSIERLSNHRKTDLASALYLQDKEEFAIESGHPAMLLSPRFVIEGRTVMPIQGERD
jgi:hypothetical protein